MTWTQCDLYNHLSAFRTLCRIETLSNPSYISNAQENASAEKPGSHSTHTQAAAYTEIRRAGRGGGALNACVRAAALEMDYCVC